VRIFLFDVLIRHTLRTLMAHQLGISQIKLSVPLRCGITFVFPEL